MSSFSGFGFLTWNPKHSTFVRGRIVVVLITNIPYIISLTKSLCSDSAVMISTLTLNQKVLALLRGPCLWVCLRYQVAPQRCLSILGSGKVKKRSSNLKHYEIEKFVVLSTLTQFFYLRTYIVLILCRGMWFVNGSCTCSHLEDLERSMRARSRCLLFFSARIIAFSCASLSKLTSAARPNKWCEVDTPPTPMFTCLHRYPLFIKIGWPMVDRSGSKISTHNIIRFCCACCPG